MRFDNDLNEINAFLYVIHNYHNPGCRTQQEFEEDVARFKHLNRLLQRYIRDKDKFKETQVRLTLNHIISLMNVFGKDACVKLLFYKLPKKTWPLLVPFLEYLSILPKQINKVRGELIITNAIDRDRGIIELIIKSLKH